MAEEGGPTRLITRLKGHIMNDVESFVYPQLFESLTSWQTAEWCGVEDHLWTPDVLDI